MLVTYENGIMQYTRISQKPGNLDDQRKYLKDVKALLPGKFFCRNIGEYDNRWNLENSKRYNQIMSLVSSAFGDLTDDNYSVVANLQELFGGAENFAVYQQYAGDFSDANFADYTVKNNFSFYLFSWTFKYCQKTPWLSFEYQEFEESIDRLENYKMLQTNAAEIITQQPLAVANTAVLSLSKRLNKIELLPPLF